jgi:hypothetical protein
MTPTISHEWSVCCMRFEDSNTIDQIPKRVKSKAESGTMMDIESSVKHSDIGSLPLRL